ncbi:MAGa7180 family putative nuclease [[Mycoplasma] mobile]|uniref:Expressed protein n=1 Tax=Mycoplasma mobile (strain ATCC 43663 / 163K / NCTC 11711) TaxID=267748 RepID=Q6KHY2_MYCM1|nr:YqaJ viral recombinase family protein [[Mycoplasma] mobile]AAT27794.1 expressed protein [Mycoplasma mobile 163K]
MDKLKKRHFYNGIDYVLDGESKKLILLKEFHEKLLNKTLWGSFGFKKIGGSNIGDVLLKNEKFHSEFSAFAKISYLNLPILDPKYVNAGIMIEPKVIEAIEQISNYKVQTFDPKKYNYDYFSDKDEIVGGIPDGYVEEKKIILEIKTTKESNFENWEKYGVPNSYLKQSQLYSFLMGVEEFAIVATFLKNEDYENPENYPIKKRKIKSYKYKINKEQVLDDLEKVKNWYHKHTKTGVSPEYNVIEDKDLLDYLKCQNEEEWLNLLKKWDSEGKVKVEYGNW